MKANPKYKYQELDFWANVKLISQKIGYFKKGTFVIPSIDQIKAVYENRDLDYSKIINDSDVLTKYGELLIEYFTFRGEILSNRVQPNLMRVEEARKLFYEYKEKFNPKCPLPYNKQKGEKKDYAFLTGIVNMLIEANLKSSNCDYNPMELTSVTIDKFPVRTLSRRVDGAFPSTVNPVAIWEIKEYYYTTTFGSRVADGVYESLLDGFELRELKESLGVEIEHYLFLDDHFTWWEKGKSYLCRIIDMLHMGILTEALFGREVVDQLPDIVNSWQAKR